MIVLDTNVLSAIMKPESNAPAIEWLNRQDHELLRLTVVSLVSDPSLTRSFTRA